MEKIDEYVQQRNLIQLKAENINEETAQKCWAYLGVANRHIERVIRKQLPLEVVESEILDCFQRTNKLMGFGDPQDGQHRSTVRPG